MRLNSMIRIRIITLLGLTTLVAMMVTLTRFSSSFNPPNIHLMISQNKLNEYQQTLRLIASEQNSNKTINNLLENLMHSKSELQSNLDGVNSEANIVDKEVVPKIDLNMSSISNTSQQTGLQSFVNNLDETLVTVINRQDTAVGIDFETNALTKKSKVSAPIKPVKTGSEPKSQTKFIPNSKLSIVSTKSTADIPAKVDIDLDDDQRSNQSNQKLQQLDNLENNENKITKIEVKPKLVFDREDLKSTETMKIDKPLGCEEDFGASLDLLVVVNSAVDHFEARSAVRETWGQFAVERGAKLLFLIGSTTNSSIQKMIIAEDNTNSDLLQGKIIDNYFNLTLKTISMMKWLSDRCYKVKYVLKVDDDMFVNMQHITDFTETRFFNKCIIGKLAKKWKPHRNKSNKWYVPIDAYNGELFPTFATGPAYMISGDAVRPLYECSIKLKPIYLEDVYMTGIVAEKAHIRRLNHGMITNVHIKDINACNFSKFMTSHKHSPQEIRRLWQLVYSQPQKPCAAPKTTPKPSKPVNIGSKSVTQTKPKPVLKSG